MKQSIKYGLVSGLLIGIWNLSCFSIVTTLNTYWKLGIPSERIRAVSGLLGIVLLVIGITIGTKAVRRENGNTLTYGQAVLTGIGISVVTAFITSCFAYVYCTFINPGYTDFMVEDTRKVLQQAQVPAEELQKRLALARTEFSTKSQVLQSLIGQSVVGSISSLIIGIFIKTKNSEHA